MKPHLKNNQITQRAIHHFLQTIHHEPTAGALSSIFDVVVQIFNSAGQKYLLHLVKLRRYWLEQSDEFLARHAYPQNFSIVREMTVTPHYLSTLCAETSLTAARLAQLRPLENLSFTKNRFLRHLQRHCPPAWNEAEQAILLDYAVFQTQEIVLHLVVYDGAFSQAIQFEMPSYLKQINSILKDIQVDRIAFQVGDLGQKRQDQVWVGRLAENWERLVSSELMQVCMPAFIQRKNYYEATLVIYVTSMEVQKELENLKVQWLSRIYQAFPELQFVIQKIHYLVQPNMNAQQVQTSSILSGDSAYDPLSSYDRLKQLIEQYAPSPVQTPPAVKNKKNLSSAEHRHAVQQIIQRMKEKTKKVHP